MSWFTEETICMQCSEQESAIKSQLRESGVAPAWFSVFSALRVLKGKSRFTDAVFVTTLVFVIYGILVLLLQIPLEWLQLVVVYAVMLPWGMGFTHGPHAFLQGVAVQAGATAILGVIFLLVARHRKDRGSRKGEQPKGRT